MAIAMVPIAQISPISGSERTALTTCCMQMSVSLDIQGVREVDFDWKKSSGDLRQRPCGDENSYALFNICNISEMVFRQLRSGSLQQPDPDEDWGLRVSRVAKSLSFIPR